MIAASDPQEFVPSGRQQAFRHPGPINKLFNKNADLADELLLNKFEQVSLKEKKDTEWWTLRLAPVSHSFNKVNKCEEPDKTTCKSSTPHINISQLSGANLEESYSFKSTETSRKYPKRHSDNFNKLPNKRFSNDESAIKGETSRHHSTSNANFYAQNDLGKMEDELYVKENTVIWTRGLFNTCDNLDNSKKTICAYTSPLPIKHALWCTFYCEHPSYDSELVQSLNKEDEPNGVPVPAVCIIDSHNIRAFTPKGEDFVTAIPFQIGKVWNMKYGIFIEKESGSPNSNVFESRATLYSLAYPLDEVCPVAISNGSIVQILNNSNLKVVYTSENPSICMIYDSQTMQHSVYLVRKITNNEKLEFAQKMNITCPSSASLSNKLRSRLSMWECSKNPNYLPFPSPMSSRPGSVASYHNLHHSKSYSSMATVSRCQSPAPSSVGSPWLQPGTRLNTSTYMEHNCMPSSSCSYFDSSKLMSYLHTRPTVCLQHLWTDYVPPAQEDNVYSPATKVFLCDDFAGQWYICYIVSARFKLTMVRVDFHSTSNINFGLSNSVSAKDAVPIPTCHMLAILEHNGNVTLYSGLNPVGKLHIGGTLVQHTPSPYVRRNLSQFSSPFPRRSSLLPHCKPSDPKFDEHLLSPVLPEPSNIPSRLGNVLQLNFQLEGNVLKAVLIGLTDSVENRITLKYSDGTYYRIALPPMTNHPLIENCILVLKQCLSKDIISLILTRWYATRNVFGTQDMNLEEEWDAFQNLILGLLGYEENDPEVTEECPVTPSSQPKRQKHSLSGSDEDWSHMTKSNYSTKVSDWLAQRFKLSCSESSDGNYTSHAPKVNVNSVLFSRIKLIHYCLHLLYEDLKLNTLHAEYLPYLAKFLNRLSCDLGLVNYCVHYWKDFPEICQIKSTETIEKDDMKCIHFFSIFNDNPPNIMQFICDLIEGNVENLFPYPYIRNVNKKSRDIIQICGVITKEVNETNPGVLIKNLEFGRGAPTDLVILPECECKLRQGSPAEQATGLMTEKQITVQDLEILPPGMYLLLYGALWKCRNNPPFDLSADAYKLLWRDDLAFQAYKAEKEKSETVLDKGEMYNSQLQGLVPTSKQVDAEQQDGMEDIENPLMKLRFPDDIRVNEARKMLQSSKPVPIVLVQRPDVSDHDFIEEQEKHLYAICTRTMALSTGRGMFTLRTSTPVMTEPLQTPPLCLAGKAPPRGTTVELNHIDTPSNMNLWPLFHNGVANGLRITPDAHNIDNTWIIFNKPKGSVEQQMEHAGFLMALGLNGHLRNLDLLNTYDYLVKLHEMTSIGILLGLSASFRGTSHSGMTKALSIHVEALLPPTSMELDVHQNVQVAALLGIGLVYQGTCHRHIIEVLLSEIGRPPGPEMENSVDRESYSLAAGLSLGLVTLKHGNCSMGLSDLNVPDTLQHYMVGGNKRPLTGSQKDKYKVASFQIREGSSVNLDVTAPGATIALGLMYLGTGNKAVADWMAPPETQYLLDFVRPDFLMFRILARALILWDDIEPSKEWVENQVPSTIRPYCMIKPSPNTDIDYEAMNQAYCNIVTGACFALGLKYAGSADEDAFQTLLHFCHLFTNLTIKSIADLAGKPTVETCLNVLLLSISMVMAGTGNLDIMRLVRLLRRRVGVASSAVVTYGSHLALHMALGLLFLGGGRYTLSNSPANVAALICAFYPKFPTHSNDNRYHLQAFRHLYVLAVEPRLIIPKDVNSNKSCYAMLRIVKIDGTTSFVRGPGIIPDLNIIKQLSVDDERYWPVVFERGRNWDLLTKILSTNGFIEVKQRAGCLSYIVDKLGYHSQLARTLTQSEVVPWNPPSSSILSFTHDQSIKYFCDHFLTSENKKCTVEELKFRQMLTGSTYDAVVKDKLIAVNVFAFLIKVINDMKLTSMPQNFWQIKILFAQILSKPLSCNLIGTEVGLSIKQEIIEVFESWENVINPAMLTFVRGDDLTFEKNILNMLAMYVIFYEIPFKIGDFGGDFLEVIIKLQRRFSSNTIEKIVNLKNL